MNMHESHINLYTLGTEVPPVTSSVVQPASSQTEKDTTDLFNNMLLGASALVGLGIVVAIVEMARRHGQKVKPEDYFWEDYKKQP